MPTNMTQGIRIALNDGVSTVKRSLERNSISSMSHEHFYSLFWSDQQINEIRRTMDMIDDVSASVHYNRCFTNYTVPVHNADMAKNIDVWFNPNGGPLKEVVPKSNARYREDAPAEAAQALREVVKSLVDTGFHTILVHDTCTDLIAKCKTLEAMRYVFPPTIILLDLVGRKDLSAKIESIKRAPALPDLSPRQRAEIRYLNQWFAVQVMTGAFTDTERKSKKNRVEVGLSGNQFFNFEAESGEPVHVRFAT